MAGNQLFGFLGLCLAKTEPSVKSIHRRITALLQEAGWPVGKDRVQRIWDREGLKVIRCNQKFLSFGEPSELNGEEWHGHWDPRAGVIGTGTDTVRTVAFVRS